MNQGKLCISVIAQTIDDLTAKIKLAAPMADIIEVRLDHLGRSAVEKLSQISSEIPIIATFRNDSRDERLAFWNGDNSIFWACDLEEDIVGQVPACRRRIVSYHDHKGVPGEVDVIYDRLASLDPTTIKIAVTAADITDALSVWKLLDRAKSDGAELIPVAMGEAGKWTRILGPAHGAAMTYASLENADQTADGQITARDLIDVYRVRELSPETRVYGVIGDPVSQSLSPFMQNAALAASGENAVFIPLLVRDLNAFITRMVKAATREVELNFAGFSVTMPHKQAIIPHLDSIDPVARSIGAVNTVRIGSDGRLTGFNTDAHGFIAPLRERLGSLDGTRVAVIGSGGAARAVVYALKQEHALTTLFVRDVQRAGWFTDEPAAVRQIPDLTREISNYDIVVNSTPIGMKGPLEAESSLTADELSGVRLVYDLVTRPDGTPLMHAAAEAGVQTIGGIEMLLAQGARQFEIWTGHDAPVELMRTAALSRIGG